MVLRRLVDKKAQSIIEYVMLFVIVATAITLTYKYVYRSMNARLKQVQEELTYKRD
jgi:cell division protein FtsL